MAYKREYSSDLEYTGPNRHFSQDPDKYKQATLKTHTECSLESDQVRMHYHGDGTKKAPREIYVSANGKVSSRPPRIHRTVHKLMGATDICLSEEFASFTAVTPIIYGPKNLAEVGSSIELVEET